LPLVTKKLANSSSCILDVWRISTHHKNDFDEVMPVVQVSIGNYEIMNVLLDGGYGVNIIFEHLWRTFDLMKLQLAPFMVRMENQRKVEPIGLI
jgi:hypothetical protein